MKNPLPDILKAKINRITFLDGLRGLAALYVMLGHARWLLWEGFSDGFALHPERYSLLGKLAAYASLTLYYGHQAVVFFFVLSGFVIHIRYAKSLRSGQSKGFDLRSYLWRRFKRIYPIFLFAFLATFVVDQIGNLNHYNIYSQSTPYSLINLNVLQNFSPPIAAGNLLLIPDVGAWGSNGPLWSLRFEWWFYLIYPLFWFMTRRSIKLSSFFVLILFILSFVRSWWPIPTFSIIFGAFPAWWMGALLAEVYTGRLRIPFARIAVLAGLFVILPFMVAPLVQISEPIQDFLWALGFTGLLSACFAWQNRGGSLGLVERLGFLGDISYSLYVLHFPVLVFLSGWLMAQSSDKTLPHTFEWIGIGAILCIVIANAVHLLIERPLLRNSPVALQQQTVQE